jgi:UDP-glucose 4-epimerase
MRCAIGREQTGVFFHGRDIWRPESSRSKKLIRPADQSYGEIERALRWYENAYRLRYASLRYFNAAGASKQFGEQHDPETHLIPLVLQAANGTRADVQIFGDDYPTRDGTCVRDYIHVIDLARAHILALDILDERSAIYNLGCGGDGYTVKEVIDRSRSNRPWLGAHSKASRRRSRGADCQFRED